MASAADIPRLTAAQYLALERRATIKSEFLDGRMVAMSGASREHNLIAMNLSREISTQLKDRPCEAYAGDMRVCVEGSGLYTYPDLSVVCGQPVFQDAQVDTLLNPRVVIEILSASTEAYDRGKKFAQYRRIGSLTDYVLVAQDEMRVEHYVRQGDDWLLSEVCGPAGVLRIGSIGVAVPLAEVYARVELGAGPRPGTA
jgi:Uma2 family endonuclease